MNQGTSRKIFVGVLLVVLAVLIGVSILIAVRLQESSQAPTDTAACPLYWTCSDNCGCGCDDFFATRPGCCGGGILPACSGGGGTDPASCTVQYGGNSFTMSAGCAGRTIRGYRSSYDGVTSRCPTVENPYTVGTVPSGGGAFTPTPAPGECVQYDHDATDNHGGGGVCVCNPPEEPPVEPPTTNVCKAAYLEVPPNNSTRTVTAGQQITITGWAGDPDGIQRVELIINSGTPVNAQLSAINCTNPGTQAYLCDGSNGGLTGADSPVRFTYNYTVPASGTVNVQMRAYDNLGNTGTSCQGQGTLTIETEEDVPYCGDAICNNVDEKCERTAPGAGTYRACTGNTGAAPTGSTVEACTGVTNNAPVTATTCKYCGDGIYTPGSEQCDPTAPATGGNNPSECSSTCTIQAVANQCIDMIETGNDPLANGAGNVIEYTLIYQNGAASNPYPNIRLRVGTAGSPLGRDVANPSNALVAPYLVTHDAILKRYTYRFRWEAVSTNGSTPVPAGTYNVRALLDGTTELSSPTACTETLTVSQTATEEPLFSILKQGAAVCDSNGDGVVNYTISVTNVGSVTGTMDNLEDTYDAAVYSLGISPTNVSPSGTINSGTITWAGTSGERTFTAGQTKQYTYSIRIPKAQLTSFLTNGVVNRAEVQFDTSTTTDNSASFDLRTLLDCTVIIPNTAFGDDFRFILVGILFIGFGVVVFRYRIGAEFAATIFESKVGQRVLGKRTAYESSILSDYDRKRKRK